MEHSAAKRLYMLALSLKCCVTGPPVVMSTIRDDSVPKGCNTVCNTARANNIASLGIAATSKTEFMQTRVLGLQQYAVFCA